jgi:hypothetical protein
MHTLFVVRREDGRFSRNVASAAVPEARAPDVGFMRGFDRVLESTVFIGLLESGPGIQEILTPSVPL